MHDRFASEDAHIERIYRHHDAIRRGQFDPEALIPGYDLSDPNAVNLGIARLPHLACLGLSGSPVGPDSGLNFWPGPMSELQLVQGFYRALRIEPWYYDEQPLAEMAVGLSSRDDVLEILSLYRETPAEWAIRTLIGVGICDLARYIVLHYRSHQTLVERLKARSLMFSRNDMLALPAWPEHDPRCRSLVPPLAGFALLAELTRFAQNIVAHGHQAMGRTFLLMSQAKMSEEFRRRKGSPAHAAYCQTLAAALGMEALLPSPNERTSRNIDGAALTAVAAQHAAVVAAHSDEAAMVSLSKDAQLKIGNCNSPAGHAAIVGTRPRTDAVRAFGLTWREHLAGGLARLHDAAWQEIKQVGSPASAPRYPGDSPDKMSAGAAASCLAIEWLRGIDEQAASEYVSQGRLARRRSQNDDRETEGSDVRRPVKRDEYIHYGETIILSGREIRPSDPLGHWPTAGVEYDARRWIIPQTGEQRRFRQAIAGYLPAGCGAGITGKPDRRPDNFCELQRRASGNHIKTRIRTVHDDAELDFLSMVARDVTLTLGAASLSRGHYQMRDLAARMRELSARAESDKPRNIETQLSAPCLSWNGTATSTVDFYPPAPARSGGWMPAGSSLVQRASVPFIGAAVRCLTGGGSDEPTGIISDSIGKWGTGPFH